MNGCIYNYDNDTVNFINNKRKLNSLYFYGLSTVHEYRGKGACKALINFAIEFAKYNNFDYIYARTDLLNSNSEWIMEKAGMEICKYQNKIITEWVNVTETKGDFRLHLWKPLKKDIKIMPKGNAYFADDTSNRPITGITVDVSYLKKLSHRYH